MFLRVTSQRYSALSLSEVSPIELFHDSISRWLSEAKCQPKDIWNEAKPHILGISGVLIVDDTILDKQRSDKIELVRYQYSGTVHDVIKGIGMLNFLWVDEKDEVCPMDVRIYEPKEDGKTKNDHFRELLQLAKERGVKPEAVIADSWYSSLDNLKCIRDMGWKFVMGLRKNREDQTREEIHALVRKRWEIEVFHRELKQTCGLEHCQARTSPAQRNHIVLSVLTWIKQAAPRKQHNLTFYQQQWYTIKDAIALQMKIELIAT